MNRWLLNQLFEHTDQATPRFAFQGSVNWMSCMAMLVHNGDFSNAALQKKYNKTNRRSARPETDIVLMEYLLMALHNISSLSRINKQLDNPYDTIRSAVVAWYYAIYETASAMVAAHSGSKQEEHRKTAKVWHRDIVFNDLAVGPFNLHLDTLVKKDVEASIKMIRNGNPFGLETSPSSLAEATGGAISYLKGTADYEKWRFEERIKASSEFKVLNVDSFRKKTAKAIRDRELSKGFVNFLVQAFRYRGKANYRDSIFLSYGDDRKAEVEKYSRDLEIVARAFVKMGCYFISSRIPKSIWTKFSSDVQKEIRFNLDLSEFGFLYE